MKCPHCKAFGPKADLLEEHWEVRGKWQGEPVRKCRSCGRGFLLRSIRAPKPIDAELWAEMEASWARNLAPLEAIVKGGAASEVEGELDPELVAVYRARAAEASRIAMGAPLEELDQSQLNFIAGTLATSMQDEGVSVSDAAQLPETVGADSAIERYRQMVTVIPDETMQEAVESYREAPNQDPLMLRAMEEELDKRTRAGRL